MRTDFDVSLSDFSPLSVTVEERAEIESFLSQEAFLLDTRRFDEWLALWTRGGMYWVPAAAHQSSPYDSLSIFWEDATLRALRVTRLREPTAWSQKPPTSTIRSVTNVLFQGRDDADRIVVTSVFHLVESKKRIRRLDGRYTHVLARADDGLKIDFKRVDLVNISEEQDIFEVFI